MIDLPSDTGVVVSLYDASGVMVAPWLEAGHDAVIVDIEHPPGVHRDGRLWRIGADLREWVPPRWLARLDPLLVSAFPPCDHLAVSGARWFRGKGLCALADSIVLVQRAAFWCEWFGAPYFIENPVSTLSSYWRAPDHTFHPWQFSGLFAEDAYAKKTCLWTGNGFRMPASCPLPDVKPDDRIHKAPPGPGRKAMRSRTPPGFAKAVFIANRPAGGE